MKLFVACSLIAIFVLPVYLLFKRRMNVSLGIFYVLLGLGTLAELAGGGNHSIESIMWGTAGFALATGIEYAVRQEYFLACLSSLVLVGLSGSIYAVAETGAFSV